MRTYDVNKVKAATAQYAREIEGFHPEEWLANKKNIALINDNDDVALFEHQADLLNTVCGHYFFFSRGKEAVKAAEQFLEEVFETTYVQIITGLTPSDHKAALWMNRRLGFSQHGEVSTVIGPCKFVVLTKQEWKDRIK